MAVSHCLPLTPVRRYAWEMFCFVFLQPEVRTQIDGIFFLLRFLRPSQNASHDWWYDMHDLMSSSNRFDFTRTESFVRFFVLLSFSIKIKNAPVDCFCAVKMRLERTRRNKTRQDNAIYSFTFYMTNHFWIDGRSCSALIAHYYEWDERA